MCLRIENSRVLGIDNPIIVLIGDAISLRVSDFTFIPGEVPEDSVKSRGGADGCGCCDLDAARSASTST